MIDTVQENIIQDFSFFEDWSDKYEHIIELGKEVSIPTEYKTDENKVKGCQSNVWLYPQKNNDETITFLGESDALIVRGLVALVLKIFNGKTPKQILDTQPYCFEKIGLQQHLSPTRNNGLQGMIKQIKYYATALQNQ